MASPFDLIAQMFAPSADNQPGIQQGPFGPGTSLIGTPLDLLLGPSERVDIQRLKDQADSSLQTQRDTAAMDRLQATHRNQQAAAERQAGLLRDAATEWNRQLELNSGNANFAFQSFMKTPAWINAFSGGGGDQLMSMIQRMVSSGGPIDPAGHMITGLTPRADRLDARDPLIERPGPLAEAAGLTPEQAAALTEAARLNPTAASTALTTQLTGRAFPAPEAPPARNQALDREAAKRLRELQVDGDAANSELVSLNQLDRALQTNPGGFVSGVRGLAAQWGIPMGRGTSDLQIVSSMIDRLTPAQRQGLPGAASDRDVAMFRNSLPSLWQTAEGQRQVMDTLLALAQHRQARGNIASRAIEAGGGIEDAFSAIRGLPDPFRAMTQRREADQVRRLSEAEGVDFTPLPRMTRTQLREFNARMIEHYGGAANIPPLVRQMLLQRAQQIDAAGNPQ